MAFVCAQALTPSAPGPGTLKASRFEIGRTAHPFHREVVGMRKLLVAVFAALLLVALVPVTTFAHGGGQDPELAGPSGSDGGSEAE